MEKCPKLSDSLTRSGCVSVATDPNNKRLQALIFLQMFGFRNSSPFQMIAPASAVVLCQVMASTVACKQGQGNTHSCLSSKFETQSQPKRDFFIKNLINFLKDISSRTNFYCILLQSITQNLHHSCLVINSR